MLPILVPIAAMHLAMDIIGYCLMRAFTTRSEEAGKINEDEEAEEVVLNRQPDVVNCETDVVDRQPARRMILSKSMDIPSANCSLAPRRLVSLEQIASLPALPRAPKKTKKMPKWLKKIICC